MPRPQKKKKSKNVISEIPVTVGSRLSGTALTKREMAEARMAREITLLTAGLCSTKMDVAFIAAEMLLHLGRGQMAAQLGCNYSHLNNAHLNQIISETAILAYPGNPNQESTIEKLFLGFVKSVANNDPALRKQRWKTNGNSDLPFVAALSFLVGNMAWQNRAPGTSTLPNPPMTRQNIKDAFDAVSSVHCPATPSSAGGGPFCDWMDL